MIVGCVRERITICVDRDKRGKGDRAPVEEVDNTKAPGPKS
jgi:hypothetical protein